MDRQNIQINLTAIVDLILKIVAIIALGVYIGWWG
jgi:hypothetical protein